MELERNQPYTSKHTINPEKELDFEQGFQETTDTTSY